MLEQLNEMPGKAFGATYLFKLAWGHCSNLQPAAIHQIQRDDVGTAGCGCTAPPRGARAMGLPAATCPK